MSEIRNLAGFAIWSALVALFCLLNIGTARAQEIRVVAEPNQPIRMAKGGYVCDGTLTATPIDATENGTWEMVQCSGPIYNSYDYAALHAKLNRDELVRLNETMDHLSGVQNQQLNKDLKETIEKRFQELPNDVLVSAEVQNLRKSLIAYIDERVPARPDQNIHQPPPPLTPRRGRSGATPR